MDNRWSESADVRLTQKNLKRKQDQMLKEEVMVNGKQEIYIPQTEG